MRKRIRIYPFSYSTNYDKMVIRLRSEEGIK